MRYRIAFIVNNFPPRVGGVEMHVESLAIELARAGHTPFVVTLGDVRQTAHRNHEGVAITTLPEHLRVGDTLGFPSLGTRKKLTDWLRREKIDVVSVHTRFFPMTYLGWKAALKAGVPSILTEHGSNHVQHSSPLISLGSRVVDYSFGKRALRGATKVVGISEEAAAFVQRLAQRDAGVFHNAIHIGNLRPVPSRPCPERLVFVGRLVPGKGWEVFVRLIQALRTRGFPVRGEILGDGPDRPALINLIERLDLSGHIIARGFVSQDEVRNVLYGATLINPTTLSEGFQTTLLEALASHARVVTYPVPGAALLKKQGAPIYITEDRTEQELFSQAVTLLENTELPAPSTLITQWGWPSRASEYVRLIEQVAAQRSSPI